MKITQKLSFTTLLIGSVVASSSASAAIIALADVTRPAGGNVSVRQDLAATISNEAELYLVGTVTWLPNASAGGVNVSWNIDKTTDANNRNRVGMGTSGDRVELLSGNAAGDGDGAGPATAKPTFPDLVDTTPGATTSYTLVLKVDQTAPSPGGDWWFADTTTPGAQDGAGHFMWINPDLGASEASQPTPFAGWRSGNNGYKSVNFTTNGNTGTVEFTNFAIYTGGDTPFGAIPEPSTVLLGALGALALLRRRRN